MTLRLLSTSSDKLYIPLSACVFFLSTQDQQGTRIRPSDLILEVTRGGGGLGADACATPRIVEFLNLEDNTAAVTSTVRLDEPLFQPHPSRVVFEGYEAFGQQQKVLCFRNNDSVNRRVKLLPLDSPHFAVSGPRSPHKLKALKQTKVPSMTALNCTAPLLRCFHLRCLFTISAHGHNVPGLDKTP